MLHVTPKSLFHLSLKICTIGLYTHLSFSQSFHSNFVFASTDTNQLLSDIKEISLILKSNMSNDQHNYFREAFYKYPIWQLFLQPHWLSFCLQAGIRNFGNHLPFVLINIKLIYLIMRDFLMPQTYICTLKSLSYLF